MLGIYSACTSLKCVFDDTVVYKNLDHRLLFELTLLHNVPIVMHRRRSLRYGSSLLLYCCTNIALFSSPLRALQYWGDLVF